MALSNKFLSSSLQQSTKSSVVFTDNRTKTYTPLPFVETITPGKNELFGWVGGYDQYGNTIPEPNAYIYVYINGFLVNPPELDHKGNIKDSKVSIISGADGGWNTGAFFFDSLPGLIYGQTITFRAKAPLKQMSDRSVPIAIGGMPSPINIGVRGDGGVLRAPYEGETAITGEVAYWTNYKTGLPNFDCRNHLYVYIDGMHAGTTAGKLGEIFPNTITGIDGQYPITNDLSYVNLSLMVQDVPVDIPLKSLKPQDTINLIKQTDVKYVFNQPADNVAVKIYRNGIRQAENFDYDYSVDPVTKLATITFYLNSMPNTGAPDNLIAMLQYQTADYVVGETLSGIINGVNATFKVLQQPRTDTLEVFNNGLHLVQDVDFHISGNTLVFIPSQVPQLGDKVIADYQPIKTTRQLAFWQRPLGVQDGVNSVFQFIVPANSAGVDVLGNPHIFKNGVLQYEGKSADYLLSVDSTFVFNPWSRPQEDDVLLVTYYVTPILLNQLVAYLNQTKEFQDNCLSASTYSVQPVQSYFALAGVRNSINTRFNLPQTNVSPIVMRLYKNGLRMQEGQNKDYTVDYLNNSIIFSQAPDREDNLIALFSYQITDFVIGEIPLGKIDGANRTFKFYMVARPSSVQVYYNGVRLNPFNSSDYSIISNAVVLAFTPQTGDTIVVDYELAYSYQFYTSFYAPSELIDNTNKNYTFPVQSTGTVVNVYLNGLLQKPFADYEIQRQKLIFYVPPSSGDSILLEFDYSGLFTDSPKNQLTISSPYALDIKRFVKGGSEELDFAQETIFGKSGVELSPGRDGDGEFLFWFNSRNGTWKWSAYNPVTKVFTPFKKGQHITARIYNEKPFVYSTIR